MKSLDFSLVIPACDEEAWIGKTLATYTRYFDSKTLNYKIIVVVNSSNWS